MNKQEFSISAKTCTLYYNTQEGNYPILGKNKKYQIPIYQRPYSWNSKQLGEFISDIFISYWGSDEEVICEPMFIGTMQLSDKGEVIDGQQRLSTFLVLFKVLQDLFPNSIEVQQLGLDFILTKVSNGSQQAYLEQFIHGTEYDQNSQNPYIRNGAIIRKLLDAQIENYDNSTDFDIDNFTKHLLSNIYFVIIETKAGLSKTLQIFDAINTTGLDLNGEDVFKIRMYEYLHDVKKESDSVFEKISQLYNKIDGKNNQHKCIVSGMTDVLDIYQYILIARHNLPVVLYQYSTDRFYNGLFDTILNVTQHDHFKGNVSNVSLSIKDINQIIDARYEWESTNYRTLEEACCMSLFWKSRYSKYWVLAFVVLWRYQEDKTKIDKLFLFLKQLTKLYFIYSVRFQRKKNDIFHGFSYSVISALVNKPFDDVIKIINEKIGTPESHNQNYYDLDWFLTENLTYNQLRKSLICSLSAMLEENLNLSSLDEINEIRQRIFYSRVDVEHIQASHDIDNAQQVQAEWGQELNSIGNLIVLEEEINRSIKNKPYNKKIDPNAVKSYAKSRFKIVQKHIQKYKTWRLEDSQKRKSTELKKILDYLFEK